MMRKCIYLLVLWIGTSCLANDIWYRAITIDEFVGNGAERADVNLVLKNIYDATSDKYLVDKIHADYKKGNWLYEWMTLGERLAKQPNLGSKHYLAISQYFAIGMNGYNVLSMAPNHLKLAYKNSLDYYIKALESDADISATEGSVSNRNDNFSYLIHKSKNQSELPKVVVIKIADPLHISSQDYYFVSSFLKLYNNAAVVNVDLFESSKGSFIQEKSFFSRLDRMIAEVLKTRQINAKKIFLLGSGLVSNQIITAYKNSKHKLGNSSKIKGAISFCGFNHYPFTKTGFAELTSIERATMNVYFFDKAVSSSNTEMLKKSIIENPNVSKNVTLNALNVFDESYGIYSIDADILKNSFKGITSRALAFPEAACANSSTINEIVNWIRKTNG